MPHLALVYFSGSGATHQLACHLREGMKAVPGAEVSVALRICAADIDGGRFVRTEVFDALHACDAIVLGSPTYMGGIAAQLKAFADRTSDFWESQSWAGKLAAGFTVGGAANGDQSSSLHYLSVLASQHGMLWVGLDVPRGESLNPLGCQLGATALVEAGQIRDADAHTARYLGQRVATLAARLRA